MIAVVIASVVAGCTTAPLVSHKGISGLALSELGVEALMAAASMGGGAPPTDNFSNFDTADKVYLGGVIPVKRGELSERADNGTRLWIDGHDRGFLPRVLRVSGPGPHRARICVPSFQPRDVFLRNTITLRSGSNQLEAWPPIIVDCLSGEIFTTSHLGGVDLDRNSGAATKTRIPSAKGAPMLIVTTTNKRQPGWSKIAQMKTAWANGAR
jgi:hypothetical protein